jgi:hypothetical protein
MAAAPQVNWTARHFLPALEMPAPTPGLCLPQRSNSIHVLRHQRAKFKKAHPQNNLPIEDVYPLATSA